MKGMTAQPVVPSNARVPVIPCTVKSTRILSGRALVMVNGNSIGPIFILPVILIDCTAFSFSAPPSALMCFSTISSAVWAKAATANSSAQTDTDSFFMGALLQLARFGVTIVAYVARRGGFRRCGTGSQPVRGC